MLDMAAEHRRGWIVTGSVLVLFCSALVLVLYIFTQRGLAIPRDPTDFQAFYCGAVITNAHGDPYRSEPLRTCEAAAMRATGIEPVADLVVPAPLPGYAFALLGPLARLPFLLASEIWFVLGFCAVFGSIVLITRLTKLPPLWIALALVFSEGLASLGLGQLVPFVVVALCGCAYALQQRKPQLAALCAVASLIEPHLGLPAVLSMFVWIPETRRTLLACGAVLAALSLAALGVAGNVEYFTVVLPAHARCEVAWFSAQLSLSASLYRAGVPAPLAVKLGGLSYAVMLALGVWAGRRCALTCKEPAFLALVPVAFALVGGPFIHIHQMAAAIPAAFLLYARAPAARPMLRWALMLLAVPWEMIAEETELLGLFSHHAYAAQLAAVSDGRRIAEDVWEVWVNNANVPTLRATLESIAIKLPTWTALFLILVATLVAQRGEKARGLAGFRVLSSAPRP